MKCPNCESVDFYIESSREMIFIKIHDDRKVIFQNTSHEKYKSREDLVVFCTQCAWHGFISELVDSG